MFICDSDVLVIKELKTKINTRHLILFYLQAKRESRSGQIF